MLSVDDSVKSALMALTGLAALWKMLKSLHQAESEFVEDEELLKHEQIEMFFKETIIEYTNRIVNL